MSLPKFIIIGIGLLFLVIPVSVTNAQIIIQSSEGTRVIESTPRDSSSKTKGETWGRVCAPGQMEREYREAEGRERFEKQQKAAEERSADERSFRKKELEMKEKDLEIRRQEANKPIVIKDDRSPIVPVIVR